MADATLTDVIDRLRAEGQLTRNTGSHSIKSVKIELASVIDTQTIILQEMLTVMTNQAQLDEKKEKLGKASRDTVDQSSDKTDKKNNDVGILSKIFAPAKEEGLRFGGIILGPILAPLKSLVKILKVGGPVAIVVGLLWSVFKDIGENESFINALEGIRRVWKQSVLPTFKRIGDTFENIINSENLSGIMDRLEKGIQSLHKFVVSMIRNITDTVEGVFEGLNMILDGDFVKGLGNIVKSVISGLLGTVDSLATTVLELFGADFSKDGTVAGLIKRSISEFQEYFKEKWTNLVTFFRETIPDVISDILKWATDKFDGILDSIQNKWTSLVGEDGLAGIIWKPIKSVVTWVKTLFSDPVDALSQMWSGLMGTFKSITDIIYAPINSAIDWIAKKFGWRDEDAPVFSIQDIIQEWADGIIDWIQNAFSFLPSSTDIKNKLTSFLPDFMRGGSKEESDPIAELRDQVRILEQQRNEMMRAAEMNMMSTGVMQDVDTSYYDSQIADLNNQISSFRVGSRGFMDFGIGTPVMLHGIEAVVPRNTAAGEFLAANFTDNWEPIMKSIAGVESSAISQASSQPIIVTNAPTIAPVNNNVRGATNISNQNISGISTPNGSGLGRFAN